MASRPFVYKVQKTPKLMSVQEKEKASGRANGSVIRKKKSQVSV